MNTETKHLPHSAKLGGSYNMCIQCNYKSLDETYFYYFQENYSPKIHHYGYSVAIFKIKLKSKC